MKGAAIMKVKGVTEKQVKQAARRVGVLAEGISKVGNYLCFTLRQPHGAKLDCKYRKRGHSGRRTFHICYHGHYEFMRQLYEINPTTIIRSSLAVYTSKADFESNARFVGQMNGGSGYKPISFSAMCDCEK